MFPSNKNFLYEAYKDATEVPYRCLWLDLTPSLKDQRYRVRSDVLNKDKSIIYQDIRYNDWFVN